MAWWMVVSELMRGSTRRPVLTRLWEWSVYGPDVRDAVSQRPSVARKNGGAEAGDDEG